MIARPPPVLVLHLNRSQYDIVTGMTGKNYAAVTFPARMDLGRLGVVTRHDTEGGSWGLVVDPGRRMSGRVPRWMFPKREDESEESGSDIETPPGTYTPPEPGTETDPSDTTEDGQDTEAEKQDIESTSGESIIYDLKSVVAHYGGHHNGHYICYRKHRQQWFKISDHEVLYVFLTTPFFLHYYSNIASLNSACDEQDALSAGNAFMLFYERVAIESKSSANGNTNMDYAHVNSILSETETSDYSSAISDDGEEMGIDDDVTLVNGYANGNGIALKQLEDNGLRRRRGSGVEDPAPSR